MPKMTKTSVLDQLSDILLNEPSISPRRIENHLKKIGAPKSMLDDVMGTIDQAMDKAKVKADGQAIVENVPRSAQHFDNFDHLYTDQTGAFAEAPRGPDFMKVPIERSATAGATPLEKVTDFTRGTTVNRKPPMDYPVVTQEQASIFKTGARNADEKTKIFKQIQEEAAHADYIRNLEEQAQREAAYTTERMANQGNSLGLDDMSGRFTKPQPRVKKASDILSEATGIGVPADQQVVVHGAGEAGINNIMAQARARMAREAEAEAIKAAKKAGGSTRYATKVADQAFNEVSAGAKGASVLDEALKNASKEGVSVAEGAAKNASKSGGIFSKFIKPTERVAEFMAKNPALAKTLKWAGPVATVGLTAYDIANGRDPLKAVVSDVGAGTLGFTAGSNMGAALGALGGPMAPVTVPAGWLIGGGLGALGASKVSDNLIDALMSKSGASAGEHEGEEIDPEMYAMAEKLARQDLEKQAKKDGSNVQFKHAQVALPSSPAIGGSSSLDNAYKLIQQMDEQDQRKIRNR